MLYAAYQMSSSMSRFFLDTVDSTASVWESLAPGLAENPLNRAARATRRTLRGLQLTHVRPDFRIPEASMEVVDDGVFGDLVRFTRGDSAGKPPVLVVAPLSGHFATLIRDTLDTLLNDHDVYVTDWKSARDIPVDEGRFGLDEYVDHIIAYLRRFDGEAHVVALCQACPPVLTAVAVLSEADDSAVPRSMTLMAGPVDTSKGVTDVNGLARERTIDWFEKNLITTVPAPHAGRGRRVYPGFLQVTAFLSMNAPRHRQKHLDIWWSLFHGRTEDSARSQEFYEEYFAVLDCTSEFYLETVERIFINNDLPHGRMTHHGRLIDLSAITKPALLTVEGENDDVCGIGQTRAAHDLCTGISEDRRAHVLAEGAGHYGVFSGTQWREQIYPHVAATIAAATPVAVAV